MDYMTCQKIKKDDDCIYSLNWFVMSELSGYWVNTWQDLNSARTVHAPFYSVPKSLMNIINCGSGHAENYRNNGCLSSIACKNPWNDCEQGCQYCTISQHLDDWALLILDHCSGRVAIVNNNALAASLQQKQPSCIVMGIRARNRSRSQRDLPLWRTN